VGGHGEEAAQLVTAGRTERNRRGQVQPWLSELAKSRAAEVTVQTWPAHGWVRKAELALEKPRPATAFVRTSSHNES
jgi:hypothetical protein